MSTTEKCAKNKKEAKEDKIKDQKLEEQILNELPSAGTAEERFALLLVKHIESERACNRLKHEMKTQEKRFETVLREKENLQREYNKSVLMRDKLQEVCREQQKIIKSMKNENLAKLREEEERRKEIQTKFQSSLNDINQSLTKNNEENLKLRDHNIETTKKLKFLAEQYQVRETQLEKLNEQIQLESQLQQAKLNKAHVQAAMEKEILLKEKQMALDKLQATQTILKDLADREQALKEQLNWYTSKYDDFQSSLQKSNDIFATYKVEMEKLSKNTRKIEKECIEWKRKWEKSNATLIELATEKKDRDDHAARCTKQVDQLQKLLRALQHERTHLYKVLRDNSLECPALPELPPEPEAINIVPAATSAAAEKEKEDKDKMAMMTKNCAEIKQTLASLQSQIKTLKLKETEANALILKTGTNSTAAAANMMKQQQQQEEAMKKQQKKKKQKLKNKNNKDTGANGSSNAAAMVSSTISADEQQKPEEEEAEVHSNTGEKEENPVEMVEKVEKVENVDGNSANGTTDADVQHDFEIINKMESDSNKINDEDLVVDQKVNAPPSVKETNSLEANATAAICPVETNSELPVSVKEMPN